MSSFIYSFNSIWTRLHGCQYFVCCLHENDFCVSIWRHQTVPLSFICVSSLPVQDVNVLIYCWCSLVIKRPLCCKHFVCGFLPRLIYTPVFLTANFNSLPSWMIWEQKRDLVQHQRWSILGSRMLGGLSLSHTTSLSVQLFGCQLDS